MNLNKEVSLLNIKIQQLEYEYKHKIKKMTTEEKSKLDVLDISRDLNISTYESRVLIFNLDGIESVKEKYRKWSKKSYDSIHELGTNGDTMTFEEIADRLEMQVFDVKRIFERTMKRLKIPNFTNRGLWEYDNIGSTCMYSSDTVGKNS